MAENRELIEAFNRTSDQATNLAKSYTQMTKFMRMFMTVMVVSAAVAIFAAGFLGIQSWSNQKQVEEIYECDRKVEVQYRELETARASAQQDFILARDEKDENFTVANVKAWEEARDTYREADQDLSDFNLSADDCTKGSEARE